MADAPRGQSTGHVGENQEYGSYKTFLGGEKMEVVVTY